MRALSLENDTIAGTLERQPPVAEGDDVRRNRARMRWFLGGVGAGLALDLVATAVLVAGTDYTLLDAPKLFGWFLFWALYFGAITGFVGLCVTHQPGPWRYGRPRFRTRTLMVAIAYLACLLGTFLSFYRLGSLANAHAQKSANAAEMVKVFQAQRLRSEGEAILRSENVRQIQAGKIPEGLFPGQADFLRSLDQNPKITPEHRQYRRQLILETQVDSEARANESISFCRRMVDYQDQLATKHHQASLRPWLPVEPDPPLPK